MCGIYFYYSKNRIKNSDFTSMNFLSHRGPNEQIIKLGEFEDNTIYGFTRLSIRAKNDGQQPYEYNGSISMINGELFNEESVKEDLLNDSVELELPAGDMQILGLALIRFGPQYLQKCRGQFAGIVHLIKAKEIIIFRDYMGEKPMFFRIINNEFLEVCSEVRFLFKLNGTECAPSMNKNDIKLGFYNSENDPNICEVMPGSYVKVNLVSMEITRVNYREIIKRLKINSTISLEHRLKNFEKVMLESVDSQLVADNNVDLLLSGGLDSSLVLFFAKKVASKKINTFTVGFKDLNYDESKMATEIANFIGVENQVISFSDEEFASSIKNIIEFMDVPILDPACIPLFNLLNKISGLTNCVLTGDGGDEITRGYYLFRYINQLNIVNKAPNSLKNIFETMLDKNLFRSKDNYQGLNFKFDRLSDVISEKNLPAFKTSLSPFAGTPIFKAIKSNEEKVALNKKTFNGDDLETYYINYILPNIYLRKSDRMSMANSVELRAPLLDQNLVRQGFNFTAKELKKLGPKGPITYLAKKYLPRNFSIQKKHGFSFKFNDLRRYLGKPNWQLEEIGLSSKICNDLWYSNTNNYNYSLALWAIYVLNELKIQNKLSFI